MSGYKKQISTMAENVTTGLLKACGLFLRAMLVRKVHLATAPSGLLRTRRVEIRRRPRSALDACIANQRRATNGRPVFRTMGLDPPIIDNAEINRRLSLYHLRRYHAGRHQQRRRAGRHRLPIDGKCGPFRGARSPGSRRKLPYLRQLPLVAWRKTSPRPQRRVLHEPLALPRRLGVRRETHHGQRPAIARGAAALHPGYPRAPPMRLVWDGASNRVVSKSVDGRPVTSKLRYDSPLIRLADGDPPAIVATGETTPDR